MSALQEEAAYMRDSYLRSKQQRGAESPLDREGDPRHSSVARRRERLT